MPTPQRVLIIGASGMLGHKLYQIFSAAGLDTYGTIRQPLSTFKQFSLFDKKKIFEGVDVTQPNSLEPIFKKIKPTLVINAVGVVKQVCNDHISAITLNSLFPHQLAALCSAHHARLIHISTDCVFLGDKGSYSEISTPDANDLYGRSKLLGEVTYGGHLTIRTSIIGLELFTNHGLVEWFLSQKGEVKGYTNAIFSGLSTEALSLVLIELSKRPEIEGLLHIGTQKIDKKSLLEMVKKEFGREDIIIKPFTQFKCDRSLDCKKMKSLGIKTPSYAHMVARMAQDPLYSRKK